MTSGEKCALLGRISNLAYTECMFELTKTIKEGPGSPDSVRPGEPLAGLRLPGPSFFVFFGVN